MKGMKEKILVLGLIALILLMIGCTQGGGGQPSTGAPGTTGKAAETPKSGAELENLDTLPDPSKTGDTKYLDAMNTGEITEGIGKIKPTAPTVNK